MNLDQLKQKLMRPRPQITDAQLLSTGSSLLNLACSGRVKGGVPKGAVVHLVGDSNSGKTWLTLSLLAEAALDPEFKHYRFIHDIPEYGALMDIAHYFGKKVRKKLEPPAGTREDPIYSTQLEEFYDYVEDAQKTGEPFIYLLDSMDALGTESDLEQISKERKARRTGKETGGSYGTSRAKVNSARLRQTMVGLQPTGSILVILSQSRSNIGFGSMFEPRTHSGGKAIKFFSHLQLWTSVRKDLTKKVKGKTRQLGILAKIKVERSRLTGRERVVEVPIYHSFGIDDIGSCIDYLVEEGHWSERGGKIRADEFDFVGKREELIQLIEEEDDEQSLRLLVAKAWNDIEAACFVKRKSRYA